ncbi:hypothetical protein [Pseudaquabacterium pictum]|uniref:Phage tail tape measure protein domain-containing protein n=1 Tax=Pseudaquabacterium pictum TaxID=2315236 RepID=A0A480ASC7_9BURK|nr:hypothetical protein [Rubrivivax pictus]GCL64311.1 hypothetical protein AQPW35_33920 [Rubrivivax pictus]
MSNLRLQFVIDAVDRATANVTRITKSIDKLSEPARRVRASLNNLLDASRMDRVRDAIGELGGRLQAVQAWGRGVVAVGAAVAIAAGGAGFALKSNIDAVDAMLDQAKKLNIPIEMYQRLGYAAQMNGSNSQEMGQALQFISQNMVEAINGSKETALWFARVGISMDALRKMNAVQVMEAIADRFAAVGDAGQNAEKKIALMRALMGRSGAELKQTLDLGSAGLRKFYAEADALGGVVSVEVAEAMGDFNDNWDRMRFSMTGAVSAIASAALPVLNDLVQRITNWTVANRALIATRLAEYVEQIVPRLPAIATSLAQIGGALVTVIGLADRFAQALGGWETVFAIVTGVILGQGLFALSMLVPAIYAVGVALMATPFGWFAAGVAGLAAGAALVYSKWEPIKTFFSELWASIINGLNRLDSMMPSWLPRVPQIGAAGAAAAPAAPVPGSAVGAAAPSAIAQRGGPFKAEVGGTLKIEFDGNGQPRVRELRKAPGSVLDFDVYSGQVMAGS